MTVYVDDMLLLASPRDTSKIWRALEKRIDFKDPESDIERYLGARYRLDTVCAKSTTPRMLLTDMNDYAVNATDKFMK